MEIDHIIPKSQGGKDKYDNLQLLHCHCHDGKTAKDIKMSQQKTSKVILLTDAHIEENPW